MAKRNPGVAAGPELIDAAWRHGRVMPEADPEHWRQDECGAWMRREHYGREGVPAEKYASPPRNRAM